MRALTKLPGYLLALSCAFQFACNDSATNQTVSLEEIRPKSQKQQTKMPAKSPEDTLQRLINFYTNDSASLQIKKISLDLTNDKIFLDRFSFTQQRYVLTDSLDKTFTYKTWYFKDSSSCTEAFYNWLDQAGKNKMSVTLQTGQIWSSSHALYIIGKRQIIQLNSVQRIQRKNWLKWYSGTPDYQGVNYILYAQPRKKTLWLKYTNSKITAL